MEVITALNLASVSQHLNAVFSLELPSARQTWIYWNEFSRGHQACLEAEVPHVKREAEEAGFVQPDQEWDQGVILLSTATGSWRNGSSDGGRKKENKNYSDCDQILE